MGFSLGGIVKAFDPTGITSLLGSGLGGSSGGSSYAPVKSNYKRRERNPWKSKRQKKFESDKEMLKSGVKKRSSRQAGNSKRKNKNKYGKLGSIGRKFARNE